MSTNYYQYTIMDAIELLHKNSKKSQKLSKREYQLKFINLTKKFIQDELTVDEYKDSLHDLCEQYRKDYKNGK